MVEWLVPLGAFWIVASLFLGGSPAEIEGGGGFRQVLGLLASLALYLAIWFGLRAGLRAALPSPAALVVATVVTAALVPVWCRIAYRIVGLKVVGPTFAGGPAGHHG